MSTINKIDLLDQIADIEDNISSLTRELHEKLDQLHKIDLYTSDDIICNDNNFVTSNIYIGSHTRSYNNSTLDNIPHDDPFYDKYMSTSEDGSISTGFLYSIK